MIRSTSAIAAFVLGAVLAAASPASATAAGLAAAFVGGGPGFMLDAAHTPRWSGVLHRASLQAAEVKAAACDTLDQAGSAACRLDAWNRKLTQWRDRPRAEQIGRVHRVINRLPYVSDMRNWGQADYWETPLEMFERGGDCEGYALTKYFSLRALGFEDEDLRVAVVWDEQDQEEHAILLVRLDDEVWLLDNKMARPERAEDHAQRYRLIYYLNEEGGGLPRPRATQARLFQRAAAPRARLVDGGRTLVIRVDARSRVDPAFSASRARGLMQRTMPAGR